MTAQESDRQRQAGCRTTATRRKTRRCPSRSIKRDSLSDNGDNLANKGNNTVRRPVVSETSAVQPAGAAKSAVSRKASSHLRTPKAISDRAMPVRVERLEICSVGCEIRGPLIGSLLSKSDIPSPVSGPKARPFGFVTLDGGPNVLEQAADRSEAILRAREQALYGVVGILR